MVFAEFVLASVTIILCLIDGKKYKELHVGKILSARPSKKRGESWSAITVQWMHNKNGVYVPGHPNPKRFLGWVTPKEELVYRTASSSSWKPFTTRVAAEEIVFAGPEKDVLTKPNQIKLHIVKKCVELLTPLNDGFAEFFAPLIQKSIRAQATRRRGNGKRRRPF